jgi:hypothetical protein
MGLQLYFIELAMFLYGVELNLVFGISQVPTL